MNLISPNRKDQEVFLGRMKLYWSLVILVAALLYKGWIELLNPCIYTWPSVWSAFSSNHEVSTVVTSYFLSNLVCTYISQDDIRFHVILLCSVELGWHMLLCDTERSKIEFSNISPDKNSKWNTSSAKDGGKQSHYYGLCNISDTVLDF